MNKVVSGIAAGMAASVPMLAAMDRIDRAQPDSRAEGHLPPRQIMMKMARGVGLAANMDEKDRRAATFAGHLGYGAAVGGLYAPTAGRLPLPPIVKGIGYGVLVWAGSYLGWLPAVGLQPQPRRRPPGRHLTMIAAHMVWGGILGVMTERLGKS